ncbi:MAG: hypothetical protein ABIX01_22910 [Chitinophagaceae bacterium]
MKLSLTLLMLSAYGFAWAHSGDDDTKKLFIPIIQVIPCKLGDNVIQLKTYQYGSRSDIVMIHLHGSEKTSLLAGMQWLKANGGLLIRIANGEERNISFRMDTAVFSFDPNHIFSLKGITNDFASNTTRREKAISQTQSFAKKILSLLPPNPTLVVALHNNFDGDYSIDSYMKGHDRALDAAMVYKNPARDPDDIFLTTDATIFQQLTGEGFNTILQNEKTVKRDGSLSVYFHEKKIRYLNCETEHGKQALYFSMLSAAMKYIERCNNNERLITFQALDSPGILHKNISVYKDSVYQGEIKSAYKNKDGIQVSGKFSWREKAVMHESISLQLQPDQKGDTILVVRSMHGPVIKTAKQITLIKIETLQTQHNLPAREIVDTVAAH